MTTDPYADADRATFGPGSQAPVAPEYGISDPFTAGSTSQPLGATAYGNDSAGQGSSTKQAAADQAGQVKDTAKDAASQVAGTAKSEAGNVVGEAKDQALGLLDQAKGQAGEQASTQQQRLAGIVGSYARELGSMASSSKESGPLTDLTHQASEKAGEVAHWLENHEPAQVLDEVRRFARRRPGAFLLGAVAAGVVVGRLTRGAVDDARSDSNGSGTSPAPSPQLTSGTAEGIYDQGTYGQSTYAADPLAADVVPGYETEPRTGYAPADGTTYGSTYGTTSGDVIR